jgi:uncharacterized protein (TIGR02452 family)
VFGNDPANVAEWMHEVLTANPLFAGAFSRIVFAVLDRTDDQFAIRSFSNRFSEKNR